MVQVRNSRELKIAYEILKTCEEYIREHGARES